MTESEKCVCLSVRARVCVCLCGYLPARGITHSLFFPLPFGSLTQTNHTLITIPGKPLPLNKCQLDDNLQAALEESGCSEAKQVYNNEELFIIVLDASCSDQERGEKGGEGDRNMRETQTEVVAEDLS